MRDFKKPGSFGGRKPSKFGGRPARSFGDRPSFGAAKPWAGRDSRPGKRDMRGQKDFALYHAVCSACGQSCEVPFKPGSDRPVFCKNCFDKNENGGKPARFDRKSDARSFSPAKPDPRIAELTAQVESLNRKVEALFKIVNSSGQQTADFSSEHGSEYPARSSFTPKKFSKKGLKKGSKKRK